MALPWDGAAAAEPARRGRIFGQGNEQKIVSWLDLCEYLQPRHCDRRRSPKATRL
jgi:hypothetical protein